MQPYPNPNYFNQLNTPYNPTVQYMPTAYQQPQTLHQIAKIVPDYNSITVGDVPTDGTPAFFIKGDYSEIQSRRWTEDGRITASTYKLEADRPQEEPDPFAKILARLDAIEEKLPAKTAPRAKKEVAADE